MRSKKINKPMLIVGMMLTVLPIAAGAVDAPYSATGAPDAGVLLNELEPGRHVTPRPAKPVIDNKMPVAKTVQQDVKAHVSKVIFECSELDVNERLQPVAADKIHRDMSFADMQALADAATATLRQDGYMTAVAYVPSQDLSGNVLKVKVIIGRYGDVYLSNKSSLMNSRLVGYTQAIRPGQLINDRSLNKALLILNDIPGMSVKASMEPGTKAGTAKLYIQAADLERQGGYVYADNYGNKSTGKTRFGFDYHFNNLSHVGDQLDAAFLTSTKVMRNYQLRYNLPVGRDGAMSRIAFSHMNYKLGDRYEYLNGDGLANTLEIGISVPMKRTLENSSFYDIAYRHRSLRDGLFDSELLSKKSSDSVELEIHGYQRQERDSLSYSLGHLVGKISMDNAWAKAQDAVLQTAGWYNKSMGSFYYINQLNDRWQLHLSVSGQYGWNNLDSSEDFYIGGADAVRAFPQGETGGDSGLLGTLEFRYRTSIEGLTLTAFVDGGRVFYNHDTTGMDGDNGRNLAGVGLGLIYNKSRDWYAKFDWATPWGPHYSTTNGENVHNTCWLRVVKQF